MRHGPFTLARRRCCNCGKTLGIQIWRWSDHLVVQTHGYCSACFEDLIGRVEREAIAPKRDTAAVIRPLRDSLRS